MSPSILEYKARCSSSRKVWEEKVGLSINTMWNMSGGFKPLRKLRIRGYFVFHLNSKTKRIAISNHSLDKHIFKS
jgi:hypothetical protein